MVPGLRRYIREIGWQFCMRFTIYFRPGLTNDSMLIRGGPRKTVVGCC